MNTYKKYCPNVFVAACDEQHTKGEEIIIETSHGNEHEAIVHNYLGLSRDGKHLYSITRTDGTNTATKAARKAEQRREWAAMQEAKSDQYFERSQQGLPPMGEPIKIGHHSEGRHRRALARSQSNMDKCVECSAMAAEHERKAESLERKAQRITLDMPESLHYFTEKLEQAKAYHAGLKDGSIPREHAYSLTYALKEVHELESKVKIATRLWGE